MVIRVSPVITSWPPARWRAGIPTTEVKDFVLDPQIRSARFCSR